jgi:hypothetical protein
MDPIYDIENHFQVLPLQSSQQVTLNFDQWQQGDDIITNTFQTPRVDLVPYSPDDFRSYLEDFDEYSSEHLDLFYEENFQPSFCSENEEVACLKQNTCDEIFYLPFITLPRYVTEGMVWKHIPYPKSFVGKSLFLDFRGRFGTLRRSLLSQSSSFPLRSCQSPFRFLLIPFQDSDCEKVRGSQPFEPLTFHDPFLRWIEHFPESMTWHHFFPPTRLHELDLTIPNDAIHFLTHVIFMLNLSLLWFMMKHRGRYCETLLGWFHWLFDYT